MAVGRIRAERMDPADVACLHMDRPTNLMVVSTVLWFDAPVDQAGVLPVHDDTAGPPLLPGPGGRTAGRAMAAARRAGSAAGDLCEGLRAALADPRKAAGLAGAARADAAMLRKLGFGLTADRNRLQGPLVPGKQRAWTRPPPSSPTSAARATGY